MMVQEAIHTCCRLKDAEVLMWMRVDCSPSGWVLLLDEADLVGPTFVTSKTSLSQQGVPLALCSNPINNKVYLFPLPEDMTAESAEPTQVDAIWRVARVPESDTMVTLKSAQDRFLACDQVGSVSAEREARGPQEEFVLESAQDKHGKGAFAIKSASFNKYLSVDEVAGGKLELRCDAEAVGDDEVFFCKMQAEFLGKNEEERNRKQRKMTQNDGLIIIGDLKGAENANMCVTMGVRRRVQPELARG